MTDLSHTSPVAPYVKDFVERYKRGASRNDFTGDEALQRYTQVIGRLENSDFETYFKPALVDVLQTLSTGQLQSIARTINVVTDQPGAYQNGTVVDVLGVDALADLVTEAEREQPGRLVKAISLLEDTGNGISAWANKPLAKTTLGGIAAGAASRILNLP